MHRGQVCLAVLKQKVVKFLFRFHLGTELVDTHSGEVVLLHGNVLDFRNYFGGTIVILSRIILINIGYCNNIIKFKNLAIR
jgi:hypothetical protein